MLVRCVLKECRRSFDRAYTYEVPAPLCDGMAVGCLVSVPFGAGNRKTEAFVLDVEPAESGKEDATYKSVIENLSGGPVLRPDQIRLGSFMRDRYYCTYGDAFRTMCPPRPAKGRSVRTVFLEDPPEAATMLSEGLLKKIGQIRVVEMLLETGETLLTDVLSSCHVSRSTIDTLSRMRVVGSGKARSMPEAPETEDGEERQAAFVPNEEQREAIAAIDALALDASAPGDRLREALLFGITGSGKTEVYLHCARHILDAGRSVLILVPEISLTPQMVSRIRGRFGDLAAVMHSRLTPRDRYAQWRRVMDGSARVVVGARSAVFAPLENIGLIVIDEEQESTYKSETTPRYHARTVARYRAIQHGAALVLGSATPAVETYYLAEAGRSRLLRLTQRAAGAAIATAEVIDMREELQAGNPDIFSRSLRQAMQEAFATGRQALLFLNRRGHSGFLLCRACGYVRRCLSCSVSMTLHKTADGRASMICHYCGRVEPVPDKCPRCGNEAFGRFGAGTQQVEERFLQVFPDSKALRMDQDTTTGRISHADILDRFGRGESDVLIGTQMIAKGHDYPNVTVAGILSADLMLGMGDFRAGERAFQLITQAAGRAGRGQAAGKVYIQAYNTDDYAVQPACRQDYEAFYRQEIVYRRTQGYPPFGVIGLVTLLSADASMAAGAAVEISHRIREICAEMQGLEGISVSDPAKAPVYRLRDRYRWRLVIRAAREPQLSRLFSALSERPLPTDVSLSMDIDPFSLM